jgi:hypothetical protein
MSEKKSKSFPVSVSHILHIPLLQEIKFSLPLLNINSEGKEKSE